MGRGAGGGEACIIGCIWRSPLFWVARSNQITGLRKTPLGREIWLTANPLTENLAQIGYRPYYQRAGIREISRLRSHVLGKFPGKSSSREISRGISREIWVPQPDLVVFPHSDRSEVFFITLSRSVRGEISTYKLPRVHGKVPFCFKQGSILAVKLS